MLMRLRQHAADRHWPLWVRVVMARPGAYHVARVIWEWPRRDAFMESISILFNRTYMRGEAGKIRRRHASARR